MDKPAKPTPSSEQHLLRASRLLPQGAGLAPVLLKRAGTLELDWAMRQKSRFDALDSLGRPLGVFLPQGTRVRGGDVLLVEDGSMVRVIAAPQAVLRITACTAHGSPFDLTRAAYQLGHRHVPIELKPDHLKIEPDPVLADMLRAMHLTVEAVDEAFEPEGTFYSAGGHEHRPADSHAHAHAHAPVVAATPQAAHVHGPDCHHGQGGHDHGHAPQALQPVAIQIHQRKPHSH